MLIVLSLAPRLPQRYVAHPRVHRGSFAEIDVSAYEKDLEPVLHADNRQWRRGTAVWAPPAPPWMSLPICPPRTNMRSVFTTPNGDQRLVAAIELVSPANKDRPEIARPLSANVPPSCRIRCRSRSWMLSLSRFQPLRGIARSHRSNGSVARRRTAARLCRGMPGHKTRRASRAIRGTSRPGCSSLQIGQPLPTLPLWLADDLSIPLDLEESYEETCKALRIP